MARSDTPTFRVEFNDDPFTPELNATEVWNSKSYGRPTTGKVVARYTMPMFEAV